MSASAKSQGVGCATGAGGSSEVGSEVGVVLVIFVFFEGASSAVAAEEDFLRPRLRNFLSVAVFTFVREVVVARRSFTCSATAAHS